uniref:Uncharacterized protein n=1 Tax=Sinocyclocheilus rhinocerous TaxID=307959 RepID=A0A673FXM4_9TELE
MMSEAERAVQTVKKLLVKTSDPSKGLHAYRSTPLANSYSPAELSMGRSYGKKKYYKVSEAKVIFYIRKACHVKTLLWLIWELIWLQYV